MSTENIQIKLKTKAVCLKRLDIQIFIESLNTKKLMDCRYDLTTAITSSNSVGRSLPYRG